jgi:hypothetical protein
MRTRASKVVGVIVLLVASSCGSSGSSGNATWRLVADGNGRPPATPMVATTAEAFDAMARLLSMPGVSAIDVGTEIAIGVGVSSLPECERLVDVKVDLDAHLVRPIIQLSKGPCSTVAIGRVIIVAVRRDRLPTLPFTVQQRLSRCERDCDGPPLVVDSL